MLHHLTRVYTTSDNVFANVLRIKKHQAVKIKMLNQLCSHDVCTEHYTHKQTRSAKEKKEKGKKCGDNLKCMLISAVSVPHTRQMLIIRSTFFFFQFDSDHEHAY